MDFTKTPHARIFLSVMQVVFLFSTPYAFSIDPADLPSCITPLSENGSRPDWSLDGKRIVYLDPAQGGNVWELDLETGNRTNLTSGKFPSNVGAYRVLYMANGDYFITAGPGRDQTTIYILDKSKTGSLKHINDRVHEGPTVSRTELKIAWSEGQEVRTAEIIYENGEARLANTTLHFDVTKITPDPNLPAGLKAESCETQNFVPPYGDKLTLYIRLWNGYAGSYTYDFSDKTFQLFSSPYEHYHEVEGIFPNGKYTLIESTLWWPSDPHWYNIEIYMNSLDRTGPLEKLTEFQTYDGGRKYKASNPVVRDDCMGFALMEGLKDASAGSGTGIYYFDLVKAGIRDTLSPQAIPSTIEAEHYLGKVGGTITKLSDGQWAVSDLTSNDWLDYNLHVPAARAYSITITAASTEGAVLAIKKFTDLDTSLAVLPVSSTGGAHQFKEVSATVNLPAGLATYRIEIESGTASLNKFQISEGTHIGIPFGDKGKKKINLSIVNGEPSITMYSSTGRLIHQSTFAGGAWTGDTLGKMTRSIHLAEGIYLVVLQDGKNTTRQIYSKVGYNR